jgi:hypothetical protein
MNSGTIIPELIIESSNKLRDLFGLTGDEVISEPFPRIVTRKDPSLDNYFADLLLRACYKKESRCPDFEEIVIRGSDEVIPVNLNPNIRGAVLIGIGGKIKIENRAFIRAYDEHSEDGTRSVKSASQLVFFRHLEKHKRIKPGVKSILPVLNEINSIDSEGRAGENHLNRMVKDLHLSKFYTPGFIVQEYPAQWKRAIVDAILVAVCLENKQLWCIDQQSSGERLRKVWLMYREKRKNAVNDGLLMPLTDDANSSSVIFNKVLGRTTGKAFEGYSLFTLRRILFALETVWGDRIAFFIIGFLLEAKLQLDAEFHKISKLPLDETFLQEAQCSLIYYVMSEKDMKPHRGISYQLNKKQTEGIIVLKDSHRYTMAIFKSRNLDERKWVEFTGWLQRTEPGCWYIPYYEEKGIAEYILNGTRYNLGSEPTTLSKQDLIDGIKLTCI